MGSPSGLSPEPTARSPYLIVTVFCLVFNVSSLFGGSEKMKVIIYLVLVFCGLGGQAENSV